MATITLVYDCSVGIQDPVDMVAKIAAVNLYNNGTLDFLPFTVGVGDDTTAVVGSIVRRTIVFTVTAEGELQYPTEEDKEAATRQLFTTALAAGAIVSVVAADPVVAP